MPQQKGLLPGDEDGWRGDGNTVTPSRPGLCGLPPSDPPQPCCPLLLPHNQHQSLFLQEALPTTSDLFTDSIVLPSQECQTVGIIQSEALSDWFLSLGDMCLSFLNVFSWLNSLFLLWH